MKQSWRGSSASATRLKHHLREADGGTHRQNLNGGQGQRARDASLKTEHHACAIKTTVKVWDKDAHEVRGLTVRTASRTTPARTNVLKGGKCQRQSRVREKKKHIKLKEHSNAVIPTGGQKHSCDDVSPWTCPVQVQTYVCACGGTMIAYVRQCVDPRGSPERSPLRSTCLKSSKHVATRTQSPPSSQPI